MTSLKVDGGVTASDLCMQIQADTLGVEVIKPKVAETTALGAAYAAGLAVGFWSSPDEFGANWAEDRRWSPTTDEQQRAAGLAGWHRAVERTFDWVEVKSRHHEFLSPGQRAADLDRCATEDLDVLVIGAGVTGAGCALDATTRGLRTGLVEARDFAAGTSSRSTKLFHGGLRYLEQLNAALVFEALKERALVLDKLAPHLAQPVPFLYPMLRTGIDRAYAGLGIGVYDVMGAGRGVPSHLRHLGRKKTFEMFPSLTGRRCAGRSCSTRARWTTPGTP